MAVALSRNTCTCTCDTTVVVFLIHHKPVKTSHISRNQLSETTAVSCPAIINPRLALIPISDLQEVKQQLSET